MGEAVVLHWSHTGNTEKVAAAYSGGWKRAVSR